MRVLVTGGAGFIGSNFIRYWLLAHPHDQVTNLDALTYAGHLENLRDVENNPQYTFVRGNITDTKVVDGLMSGTDLVVHFAAESHVDRSIMDPSIFVTTNVLGTQVLLAAALKYKIKRFHHISTDEVFGHLGPTDAPFTESTPLEPRTPYAASKAAADLLVKSYFSTYGLPSTITNCANNFGPWCDPEKLIPRFVTNLIDNQSVPLMGKGENIRSWLFVLDHCRAIETVIEKGVVGETYCVGGAEETNFTVTQKILSLLGKSEKLIEYVPNRLGHDFRYALDDSKLRALGWSPEHDFDTWLQETVVWYQNNEAWWRPLKAGRPNIDPGVQQRF